jgi:hypothetical protein
MEADKEILVYNRDPIAAPNGSHARGHYVHPIYDLDGVRMSDDMPEDHVHHRGLFWAWTQLYVGDQRLGHPWEQRGLVWDVKDVQITGNENSTSLQADVLWRSPLLLDEAGEQIPLVRELATIRVYEAEENARIVDFDIMLLAIADDVMIAGSTDTKGYGGFSARIPLPRDMQITGQNGEVRPNLQTPSDPQPWVDFTGTFGEHGTTGFALFTHPSHPGYPMGWTIRSSGSCQNPVFPGRDLTAISTTEPMMLRYRTIMHRGDTEEFGVANYFDAYSKTK